MSPMLSIPYSKPEFLPGGPKVSLRDVLKCLSLALDTISPTLVSHHRTVAYAATRIALRMGLPAASVRNVFLAALVHDIGLVNHVSQNMGVMNCGEADPIHAVIGSRLVGILSPLIPAADIVRHHHMDFSRMIAMNAHGHIIPVESSILRLADWLATEVGSTTNILTEAPRIVGDVEIRRGITFDPKVVDGFLAIANAEGFWLDLLSERLERILDRFDIADTTVQGQDLQHVAWLLSLIIDSHSRFTATHSSGVAAASMALAKCMGWNEQPVREIGIAGFVHDIGKLLVPPSILDKPGKLTEEERDIVRAHTFHTQRILEVVNGLDTITAWAADHHETLNGAGYPFHKGADEISDGARIVAVADIFTALAEDRPYRSGLNAPTVAKILRDEVANVHLDGVVTECLLDNYASISMERQMAQEQRGTQLQLFWSAEPSPNNHLTT